MLTLILVTYVNLDIVTITIMATNISLMVMSIEKKFPPVLVPCL